MLNHMLSIMVEWGVKTEDGAVIMNLFHLVYFSLLSNAELHALKKKCNSEHKIYLTCIIILSSQAQKCTSLLGNVTGSRISGSLSWGGWGQYTGWQITSRLRISLHV